MTAFGYAEEEAHDDLGAALRASGYHVEGLYGQRFTLGDTVAVSSSAENPTDSSWMWGHVTLALLAETREGGTKELEMRLLKAALRRPVDYTAIHECQPRDRSHDGQERIPSRANQPPRALDARYSGLGRNDLGQDLPRERVSCAGWASGNCLRTMRSLPRHCPRLLSRPAKLPTSSGIVEL